MADSFMRSRLLLGGHNLLKLQQSHLMIVGLGGVGSYAAEALARSGAGRISLVDRDRVETSNINRQIPALHSTLGLYKTDVMAARMVDINPGLEVTLHTRAYNALSSDEILAARPDFVVDAIDSLADKRHLIAACLGGQIPIVSSMGMANRLDPSCIKIADIAATHTCPVARILRRELKKDGIESGLPVVFSTESPFPVPHREGESAALGSVAFVPPVAGLYIASYVVRRICSLL